MEPYVQLHSNQERKTSFEMLESVKMLHQYVNLLRKCV